MRRVLHLPPGRTGGAPTTRPLRRRPVGACWTRRSLEWTRGLTRACLTPRSSARTRGTTRRRKAEQAMAAGCLRMRNPTSRTRHRAKPAWTATESVVAPASSRTERAAGTDSSTARASATDLACKRMEGPAARQGRSIARGPATAPVPRPTRGAVPAGEWIATAYATVPASGSARPVARMGRSIATGSATARGSSRGDTVARRGRAPLSVATATWMGRKRGSTAAETVSRAARPMAGATRRPIAPGLPIAFRTSVRLLRNH